MTLPDLFHYWHQTQERERGAGERFKAAVSVAVAERGLSAVARELGVDRRYLYTLIQRHLAKEQTAAPSPSEGGTR